MDNNPPPHTNILAYTIGSTEVNSFKGMHLQREGDFLSYSDICFPSGKLQNTNAHKELTKPATSLSLNDTTIPQCHGSVVNLSQCSLC